MLGGTTMSAQRLLICLVMLALVGCSSTSDVTTGSVAGGNQQSASPVVRDDPLTRALHVGANSARAVKCGYNFNSTALKSRFMSAQAAAITDPQKMEQVNKAYDTGFNGVSKAITNPKTYCTPAKTKAIKVALQKNLAGDYTPPAKRRVAQSGAGGFFGDLFDADVAEEGGPKFGSDDWWEKQNEASGR